MGKKRNGSEGKREKREIVFDEDERRAWLTGFSKRKKERRQHGLAMQALKDRKAKLEARAERRADHAKVAPVARPEPASPTPEELDAARSTVTTTLGLDVDSEDERCAPAPAPAPAKHGVDEAQLKSGSLETMRKKVAHKLQRSAKQTRRTALNRDRKAAARVRGAGGSKVASIATASEKAGGGPNKKRRRN